MKIRWFLPGLFGFFCLASPAIAGELESWQFDQTQNLLEFTTDEGVQPRAQLVPDPTRLVIDLPGTVTGNVQRSQDGSGAIEQIRVGQFDANTVRIVVELAPGYVINPQQIQFRGISANHWTVQIPEPQLTHASADPQNPPVFLTLPVPHPLWLAPLPPLLRRSVCHPSRLPMAQPLVRPHVLTGLLPPAPAPLLAPLLAQHRHPVLTLHSPKLRGYE